MSDLNEYVNGIKNEISKSLSYVARAYYLNGMKLFHELKRSNYLEYQPAIGVLSISIELIIKSLIAKFSFRYLYKDIPIEVQLMLTYPESLPKTFNPRQYVNELRTFSYKTIEINEAISLFYHLFPEKKKELRSYLNLISFVRNISVHAALPSFQRYDLDRIAFVASTLFQFVNENEMFDKCYIFFDEKTNSFMKNYHEERIKRVKESIEAAKNKSKKIEHYGSYISVTNEWECIDTTCPICGSGAIIFGDTELGGTSYEDGPYLTFLGDYFKCEECGLELTDHEELILAGIETVHDRSDKLDRWFAEEYAE